MKSTTKTFNKGDSQQYQNGMDDLNANLTFFKEHVLKIAINRAVYKKENIIKKRHLKKFNALLHEKKTN